MLLEIGNTFVDGGGDGVDDGGGINKKSGEVVVEDVVLVKVNRVDGRGLPWLRWSCGPVGKGAEQLGVGPPVRGLCAALAYGAPCNLEGVYRRVGRLGRRGLPIVWMVFLW